MNRPSSSLQRLISATLALSLSGCAQYSTVREKRPSYTYRPLTPVGALIAKALQTPRSKPDAVLGRYIDAAAEASRELQANPNDAGALRDYNFAVGRIFEMIHDSKLQPWVAPIAAQGESGTWQFSFPSDSRPGRNPALYHILPADRYQFRGTYVANHPVKAGLGAPLIITSRPELDATKYDRFAQGKHVYYGITGLLKFEGRRCTITYADPLKEESVHIFGHTFPLAADFMAPVGLALARENPKKLELARLIFPEKFAETARLARLQPYDATKTPVLCIHGLMDSQATWTPLITALRSDPAIRKHYQFWFYTYPSGYPYPYSAAILRKQLDEISATYPGHKKIVLIGHSMGGVISRSLITDSGMTLWNAAFPKPPEKTPMSADSRRMFTESLIFKHRPEVGRVIFIAAPHRGSLLATNWAGRIGASLVHAPSTFIRLAAEAREIITLDPNGLKLNRLPNSIDTLAPNNRFVRTINTIPLTPGIPFHSIMGDRGKGGNKDRTDPVSSDGIVPYWSSHLDGAESELIVPSSHSAHQSPQAIEEVLRILKEHAEN